MQASKIWFLTKYRLAFYDSIESYFFDLIRYFFTINIQYFWQIADNKFLPIKIIILNIKCVQAINNHIKFIQLSDNTFQFGKFNTKKEDIKFFFTYLCQFYIYIEIILVLILSHLTGLLKIILTIYQECLI